MKKLSNKEFKKRLNRLHPELEIVSSYISRKTPILVKNKYGVCKVKPDYLLKGIKPTIRSAVNKISYLQNRVDELNSNLEVLDIKFENYSIVTVKNSFGKLRASLSNIWKGTNLTIRSAIDKTSYFKEIIKSIHGNKYIYDNIYYSGYNNKVELFCPIHGKFFQKPRYIIEGCGCPKCSNENLPGGYNKALIERHNKKYKDTPCIFYIIKFYNNTEKFYKVGITTNSITKRINQISKYYKYEIIKEHLTNLYYAFYIENEVIKNNSNKKYLPIIKFSGYTECFKELTTLNMKLSEHFKLKEFTKSVIAIKNNVDNTPNKEQLLNLELLCINILEPLRIKLNTPIFISSGFRSNQLNKLIGGSTNSQHSKGQAADIDQDFRNSVSNLKVFNYIKNNLDFDQLIWEHSNEDGSPAWVHVSYVSDKLNRNRVLRTYRDKKGNTKYELWKHLNNRS